MIVRGAGVFCMLAGTYQLLHVLAVVWERRSSLGSLGGYWQGFLPIVLFGGGGFLLWQFGMQIGSWLAANPRKKKYSDDLAAPGIPPTDEAP